MSSTLPRLHTPQWDYWKFHGLGNDYLVLEPQAFDALPPAEAIRLLCDRHLGLGSDGILWGPDWEDGIARLRIFNPDGSPAAKSGNGLRIFARHLWLRGWVREETFSIHTAGGMVQARILAPDGSQIRMDMGPVSFQSGDIPMTGPAREALGEPVDILGETFRINGASVGNPHCVVPVEAPDEALARRIGPLLETHPLFPDRANVQFMTPLDGHSIRIEIWERGAGYTLASGSSSCAAAAVACRLGLVKSPVRVVMPGGELTITLDDSFQARMEGPVFFVGGGFISPELLNACGLSRAPANQGP